MSKKVRFKLVDEPEPLDSKRIHHVVRMHKFDNRKLSAGASNRQKEQAVANMIGVDEKRIIVVEDN